MPKFFLFFSLFLLFTNSNSQADQTLTPWRVSAAYPPGSPVKEWYTAEPKQGIICEVLVLRRPFDPQLHLRGFDMSWDEKEVVELVWITKHKNGLDVKTEIRVRNRISLMELDPKEGYKVFNNHCIQLINYLPPHVQQLFYNYQNSPQSE